MTLAPLGANMAIETLFSTNGYGRKTHLIIDGVDACSIRWSYPLLVWDCGGEVSPVQVELFKKGIDPDNHLCKRCMRRVVAHLTQRAPDFETGTPKTDNDPNPAVSSG